MWQGHCIIEDVLRLLHLQEGCNDMGAELAQTAAYLGV